MIFFKDHVTYAQATIENHLEMLLVAGILSPNITKINPPTVMNQPKIKKIKGSVPHDWANLIGPSDKHLWYAGKSTNIDFRTITFDITTTAIPANTRTLFIINL